MMYSVLRGLSAGLFMIAHLMFGALPAVAQYEPSESFGLGVISTVPLAEHAAAPIIRRYIENAAKTNEAYYDVAKIGEFGLTEDWVFVGEYILEPGQPAKILLILANDPNCDRFGCTAHFLTRQDDSLELYLRVEGFRKIRDSKLVGFVYYLTKPIMGRPLDKNRINYGPPTEIPPSHQGRPTMIWGEDGVFWNGMAWQRFCWARNCDEG